MEHIKASPQCGHDPPPPPFLLLTLRRTHLVEDTFRHLAAADHCFFQMELLVRYKDNMAFSNVNRNDLFLFVFKELMDPDNTEMFFYNDGNTLAWFHPKPRVEVKKYFLFGVLCGLVPYNRNIANMPFPLALFKKLLGVQPNLDDMREFEPVMAESWRYILEDCPPEEVDSLEMTFTMSWGGETAELDPEEPGKQVTWANRKEFVKACVNHAFNTSVEEVFQEFKRGFFTVCNRHMVKLFEPEDLRTLMLGQEEYDWEVFKKNTVYEGVFNEQHPTILALWQAFENLTAEEKKKFLLFVTGFDRVPFNGMASVKMRVRDLPDSNDLHWPEALTCHVLLYLPVYQNQVETTMLTRLREAIHHKRGFLRENMEHLN